MLAENRILAALETRGGAHGTWVQMRSPEACVAAGATGFDFVIADMQHGSFGLEGVAEMTRATLTTHASPIVRLPRVDPVLVGQVLDAGAHGVLVPDLRNAEEAGSVVAAARYAPSGTRGACPTVAANGQGAVPWAEHRGWASGQVVVWGLIESVQGVENVEAIAASGLHALVVGPFDLAMAMGLDGDVNHPDVVAAMGQVLDACLSHGIECVAVLFDADPERVEASARQWLQRGCRIVTALSDRWCLNESWSQALAGLRRTQSHPAPATRAGGGPAHGNRAPATA